MSIGSPVRATGARRICADVLEWLWLRQREHRARTLTREARTGARRAHRQGRTSLDAARELSRPRTMSAAAIVYQDAIASFASAFAQERGDAVDLSGMTTSAALDILRGPLALDRDPVLMEAVIKLGERRPLGDDAAPELVRALLEAADQIASRAARLAEAPTIVEIWFARARRVLLMAGIGAAVVTALTAWIRAPMNVARGKPVHASSVRLGSPEALVNGAIEWGTFALHTNGGSGWVEIDLVRFYGLVEARIYNRGDSFLDESVPLEVELSADGNAYEAAGQCTEFFTQATPCIVPLKMRRARFVRVSSPRAIVLSEIEVLGR